MNIFIYGSLKRGFSNHAFMERLGAIYINDATTYYSDFDLLNLGAFPGMVYGKFRVRGEIFSIEAEKLYRLDSFEGSPGFYARQPIVVLTDDGVRYGVQTYILQSQYRSKILPVKTFFNSEAKIWKEQ